MLEIQDIEVATILLRILTGSYMSSFCREARLTTGIQTIKLQIFKETMDFISGPLVGFVRETLTAAMLQMIPLLLRRPIAPKTPSHDQSVRLISPSPRWRNSGILICRSQNNSKPPIEAPSKVNLIKRGQCPVTGKTCL